MSDSYDNASMDSDSSDSRPTTRSSTRENGNVHKVTHNYTTRQLHLQTNRFMENFNPETSARERRKLNRKFNTGGPKKVTGAIFDESGSYLSDGLNLCDCLFPNCAGCFFPCSKCESEKCGSECRSNRKYMYESVDIEGFPKSFKNTHGK